MEEIAISKFKATCLAVLKRVNKTRRPVVITRYGQPVAGIAPPTVSKPPKSWLGTLAGTGVMHDDLIRPVVDAADWRVMD